jgi:hypothetical protein
MDAMPTCEVDVSFAAWAQIFATAFLGVAGLWLAHNYRRQIRVALVERQLDAFLQLWKLTAVAMPDRSTPLDRDERKALGDAMAHWYFSEGYGLFLPLQTRNLFAAVGFNLNCNLESMKPTTVARQLTALSASEAERRRGCMSIRQVALLRAKIKSDLAIHFGDVYMRSLRTDDRDFLRACYISPRRKPWRPRLLLGGHRQIDRDPCICGHCPA